MKKFIEVMLIVGLILWALLIINIFASMGFNVLSCFFAACAIALVSYGLRSVLKSYITLYGNNKEKR